MTTKKIHITRILLTATFLAMAITAANAATFTVTNTNDSGAGSLRQAVIDANTSTAADTIVFDASFNTARTITLATVITINPTNADATTITGPGANLLTISGNNAVGIFLLSVGDSASFSGMTLVAGNVAAGSGAAITSQGSMTVTGVNFSQHNDASIDINGVATVTTVTNCNFTQNLSNGIVIDAGTVTVSNSSFIQNGGAGITNAGTLSVQNSIFDTNTNPQGGAISNTGGLTVSGSTFTNNTATSTSATGLGGGAIYSLSTATPVSVTVTNSTFTGNGEIGRSGGGGAIRNRGGTMNISGSSFTNNLSIVGGGAVGNSDVMTISNSSFTNNRVTGPNASAGDGHGGGISNGWQLTVTDSSISGNSASNTGGGIAFLNPNSAVPFLNVTNTTISNNLANSITTTSSGVGGGIGKDTLGLLTITASTIVGNRVNVASGGGLYNEGSLISLHNSIVANNTASTGTDILGPINSLGYNLIRNTAGATITGSTTGNITGVDPLIGALSFNGGPSRTHALLTGSPAIDAGDPTTFPATDQRGISRPQDGDGAGGARSDIGAYERRLNDRLANTWFDFDGDAKTDISIYRPNGVSGSEWWISRSGGGNFATQFGAPTDRIVASDFTGDGKTDVSFWRPSTGFWYVLRSEDLTFYAFPFGANGDVPVPADYDADGKADVAVFRESATTWFIQRSSDNGTTIQGFGIVGDVPVNADYDGDGRADIAIYRPSLGQWWLLRSSAGAVAYQFGSPTDKTVVGDYTGDGKADVAFWRPSTGEWFVLRSEDNSFFGFPFGIATDTPVPGDYDGDGRNDAGVFRSSNNTWYIQRTTAGTLIQAFGATGDVPLPNAYVR